MAGSCLRPFEVQISKGPLSGCIFLKLHKWGNYKKSLPDLYFLLLCKTTAFSLNSSIIRFFMPYRWGMFYFEEDLQIFTSENSLTIRSG